MDTNSSAVSLGPFGKNRGVQRMGIMGIVLTPCSVAVGSKKIGGGTTYRHNRHGFDTMPRYAVTAPRCGACTFGLFHKGGARMGMLGRSTTCRLHGRKRIIGMVLTLCSATRCVHFWAAFRMCTDFSCNTGGVKKRKV